MGGAPLFSVLVASYNSADYLYECIMSALNQSYSNVEVVVVDDCSKDSSIQVVKKIKSEKVKIFKNEINRGCGYTKRRCVKECDGELFGFLDSDDALHEAAVEVMVSSHMKMPEASLIYSDYFDCDKKLRVIKKHRSKNRFSGLSHLESHKISHFATAKKNCYDKTLGINPRYKRAVDQDFYYKMEEVGDVEYVEEALYYYRHQKESISRGRSDSLIASRYWHFKAIEDAYARRGLDEGGLEKEFVDLISRLIKSFRMYRLAVRYFRKILVRLK